MAAVEKIRPVRDLIAGDKVKILSPTSRAVVISARPVGGHHLHRDGNSGPSFEIQVRIETGEFAGRSFTEHCAPGARIITYA